MQTRWVALSALCLCVCLCLPAAAEELPPLKILVRPAKPGTPGPWSGWCDRTVQSRLVQAGLEVMDLPPPGELERLARAIGETDEAPSAEVMAGADIVIHHELLPELAPGGAKTVRLRLEAIEQATGNTVATVLRASAPFGEGAGQDTRAVSEVCSAGGAELLQQLREHLAAVALDGMPLRIEVRDGPKGLDVVLVTTLKKTCTKVQLKSSTGAKVAATASCKDEPNEVAEAVLEALEAKFPRGGCERSVLQYGLVVLGCKPRR